MNTTMKNEMAIRAEQSMVARQRVFGGRYFTVPVQGLEVGNEIARGALSQAAYAYLSERFVMEPSTERDAFILRAGAR